MAESAAPSEIVKGILQGVAPPRPLFLPIVFSHAARIDNVPLRAFLTNPTKISNSLRQLRARLRGDGITCYFDPLLEAEALGANLEWGAEDRPPTVHWPEHITMGEVADVSGSSAEPASGGRVPIAIDVIRRLKTTLRADCLLMASVTGPLTLAARLAQLDLSGALEQPDIPASALELATAVISGIATAYVEAGANAVLIREEFLPAFSEERFADWCSRLAPTINIVRFYQALPVLVLTYMNGVMANRDAIVREPWDCVVCHVVEGKPGATMLAELGPLRFGVALSPEAFAPDSSGSAEFDESVRHIVSDLQPAVITTAGDLPAAVDIERLNKLWENIRRR
jgi:uroporphyrinogen-III decarboxylase